MKLEYRPFDIASDVDLLPELVTCYRDVFATPPWNEWFKCTTCGQNWGKGGPEPVDGDHCDHQLVDYWPASQVTTDFQTELAYPGTSCWIAHDGKTVIGFCHGYPATGEKLEAKLELPGLANIVKERFGDTPLAYQDEIGVLESHRGHHIATQVFRRRNADFEAQGLQIGLIRTMSNPPSVTFQWYTRLGYEIIAEYHDTNGRVIMALPLADLPPHLRS